MLKHALHRTTTSRGQTLVELAMVFPLFIMVFLGVIVLGIGVFYNQQVTNAAREGARYAAIHSATSRCPTVSNLDPDAGLLPLPNSYYRCDAPEARWPEMTTAARSRLFGMPPSGMQLTACWSGYWTKDGLGNWADYDQIATTAGVFNFRECTVPVYGWTPSQDPNSDASSLHVINPRTGHDSASDELIKVDCTKQFPVTTDTDDMASSYSASNNDTANQVTVLVCYPWQPPIAGFLLIPKTVNIQAVVSQGMEYQQ